MLTELQIETAVNWWKSALERPYFDNGDDSPAGMMSMVMASKFHDDLSPQQIQLFGEALRNIMHGSEFNEWPQLDVDYHPDQWLSEAAMRAGIAEADGLTTFPWKTYMWFRNGGVSVRSGYGAPALQLLNEKAT